MSDWHTDWNPALRNALLAPFERVGFLPKGGGGEGKKQGMAYIDARDTMKRLDDTVGPGNWSFAYSVVSVNPMMVTGILTVLGVTKCDAGEATAEGEQLKSAVSDALKRCGVHFGIGRYLYELDPCWGVLNQWKRWEQEPRIEKPNLTKALKAVGYSWSGELPSVETVSPDRNDNAPSRPAGGQQQRSVPAGGQSRPPGTTQNSAPSSGLSLQCEVCKRNLTEKIVSFCKSKGMPPLCMDHQREWTPMPLSPEEAWDKARDDANDPNADYPDPFQDE